MSGPNDGQSRNQGDFVLEELTARVTRLEIRQDDLETSYDALEHDGLNAAGQFDGEFGQQQPPRYPDLDTWVETFFAVTFTRSLGGEFRWCTRWREHTEAVFRLDALWRAFETLRRDPALGTAVWLRDHLDQQHGLLLSNRGPFALCTSNRHEVLAPLPVEDTGD